MGAYLARRFGGAVLSGVLALSGAAMLVTGQAASAQDLTQDGAADLSAQAQALGDLILLGPTLEVFAREGVTQGTALGTDLLGPGGAPSWSLALSRIYDAARLHQFMSTELERALATDPALVADAAPFLSSDLAQRIMALEVEARRTIMDAAAKTAAQDLFTRIEAENGARLALIERLVQATDLIEGSVMSALNESFVFLRAMDASAAGAFGPARSEDEVLDQVWSGEPMLRENVVSYVYPVMALAYGPIADEALRLYVEFAESPEGRRLTKVLNRAYGALAQDVARALGTEAGRLVAGQEL